MSDLKDVRCGELVDSLLDRIAYSSFHDNTSVYALFSDLLYAIKDGICYRFTCVFGCGLVETGWEIIYNINADNKDKKEYKKYFNDNFFTDFNSFEELVKFVEEHKNDNGIFFKKTKIHYYK